MVSEASPNERPYTEDVMARDRASKRIVARLAKRAIDNADAAAKKEGRPYATLAEVDQAAEQIADRVDSLTDNAASILKVARGE